MEVVERVHANKDGVLEVAKRMDVNVVDLKLTFDRLARFMNEDELMKEEN